jgi:hypothetical protein
MPELRITAVMPVPDDAMGQAEAIGEILDLVTDLQKAVTAAGGTLTSKVVHPKRARAAHPSEAPDAP